VSARRSVPPRQDDLMDIASILPPPLARRPYRLAV
jgi:hypothetical protein